MDAGLSADSRYDRTSIALHWITAALVILLWLIAEFIDDFPRGSARIAARSTHITLGVILLLVLLGRIAWRLGPGLRLPSANQGWPGYLATTVHYLLYVLIAATVLLGLTNVWMRGDSYFGLFSLPKFAPPDKDLKETIENLHGTLANMLLIVAGAHAGAALVHHFVVRDGVLRRMFFVGRPK